MAHTIIDFDDVFINTDRFKDDIAEELGLSRVKFETSYNKHFKDPGRNYDPFEHARILGNEGALSDIEEAKAKIKNLFKLMETRYLNREAVNLIKELKNKKHRITILTQGNNEIQRMKLEVLLKVAEIKELDDMGEIIIAEKSKAERLGELIKEWGGQGVKYNLIDDKLKEAKNMAEVLRQAEKEVKIYYLENEKDKLEDAEIEENERLKKEVADKYELKVVKRLNEIPPEMDAEIAKEAKIKNIK